MTEKEKKEVIIKHNTSEAFKATLREVHSTVGVLRTMNKMHGTNKENVEKAIQALEGDIAVVEHSIEEVIHNLIDNSEGLKEVLEEMHGIAKVAVNDKEKADKLTRELAQKSTNKRKSR